MRNNPIFKKLLKAALDGSYSIDQVLALSNDQIKTITGDDVTGWVNQRVINMKAVVARQLRDRDDIDDTAVVENKYKTFLADRYGGPVKFDKKEIVDGKIYYGVWPQGRPN